MNRFPSNSIAVLLATVVVVGHAHAQTVYTLEAPAAISDAIARIENGKRPSGAIRILAARDDAAPYLRMALAAAVEKRVQRELAEALEEIEARAYERNMRRARWWANTHRFDLSTEFLSGCRERDAAEVANWLTSETRDILFDAAEQLGRKNRTPSFTFKGTRFTDLAGEDVIVPEKNMWPALIRAGDCTFEMWDRIGIMVAVRGRFSDPLTPAKKRRGTIGEWISSNLFVNSSIPLPRCENTLIVCAGDIELVGFLYDAVIIAGGNIRSGKSVTSTSIDNSFLCAGGDITLSATGYRNNIFHSVGAAKFGGKATAPSENVREKQKGLAYGIRFVSASDFGLEVAGRKGGIQIMGIAADSPFTKYGVKDGDVIVRIEDTEADSVATFQNQLRRAILRESVLVHIQRGKERITRIVFLDGIPLPTAPAPREIRP